MIGDIERIREVLQFIPASDRDICVKMGMAVKSEFGDAGFDVWDAWSQQDESFNAKDARDVWKSFRGNGKVTAGTLFHEAKAHGWRDDGTYQKPTPEELAERQRIAAERVAQEAFEIAQERADAAKKATAIWKAATEAKPDHPYFVRKRVSPVATLREIDAGAAAAILGYAPKSSGEHLTGRLLVAPVKVGEGLSTLELINGDGRKSAVYGGAKAGGYWSAQPLPKGDGAGLTFQYGEGVATTLSAKESNGHISIAALSAGNLPAVANYFHQRYPAAVHVILADLVKATGAPDPHAIKAAQSVNGLLAIPDFGTDRPVSAKDFNDVAVLCGVEAVKQAIASANEVEVTTPPEPLPSLPNVLPFDFAYLPDNLRGFVRDISERMQCPPDFAAVAVFVMMGTIIGRKVGIRPMKHNDWTVICNLWAAVVGNSGVMKSPTLSSALSPIKKLQAFAFEDFNKRMTEYAAQEEIAKLHKSVTKSEAKKKLTKDKTADVSSLLKSNEADNAPILNRYMTNNASYEALGELLIENPNGILVESDEIIGLLKQLDANGQEVARSFYLTAADGDKAYTFDRIMRGKGLHIPALCISIIGGIQPGVLAEYVRQATNGGAGADGLLQRFGLMVYPDISPDWREVDRYPNSEIRDAVNKLAEHLDYLDPTKIDAENDKYDGVPFLRFDEAAQAVFSEWRAILKTRLRSGEEHPSIISHLSKYRKLIPSLALINHLCDACKGPVSEKALLRAIAFSEYLESHAQRIYSYATRPDIDAAKTLLKRLHTGKLLSPFKVRDIYRAGWTGLETPPKAQAAIALLQEYGHLKEESLDTGGRSTSQLHWIKGDKA